MSDVRIRIDVRATRGELALRVDMETSARVVALVGANGSGKTTLLKVLAGAVPCQGTIEVGDVVWQSAAAGFAAAMPIDARRVGYVPQSGALFPHLSVAENVAFGLRDPASRAARVEAMLEAFEATSLADRGTHALSGGQRQRVARARALAPEPALLLLDEPMTALDALARATIRRTFAAHLRETDRPAWIVTHEVADALAFDAEVVVLDRGEVIQRGNVDELRAAPATEFVAAFVQPAHAAQ